MRELDTKYWDSLDNPWYYGGYHRLDATFRLLVDFDPKTEGDREVLLEIGGSTKGISLTYEIGSTLVMRVTGVGPDTENPLPRGKQPLHIIRHTLSPTQLGQGDVEILWGIKMPEDGGDQSIGLWVDGILVDERVDALGPEWTAGADCSFGRQSIKGLTSSGIYTLPGDAFTSGSINLTEGLQFYSGFYPTTSYSKRIELLDFRWEAESQQMSIAWKSRMGSKYALDESHDLADWREVVSGLEGGEESTSFTYQPQPPLAPSLFYRVREVPE